MTSTMSDEETKQFIEGKLAELIINGNEDMFGGHKLVKCVASKARQLDGFMSAIYMVQLISLCQVSHRETRHDMIVKLMKGDQAFRDQSKSDIQFANEVYIYGTVFPYYKKFLNGSRLDSKTSINMDNWTPKVYFAAYGIFPELGPLNEAILVVQDLKPLKFRMGPHIDLDTDHLMLMTERIAEYHSLTYALRITGDPKLTELIAGVRPLPFKATSVNEVSLYDVIYRAAFQRLFEYVDRTAPKYSQQFLSDIALLREKSSNERAVNVMELFRRIDEQFSVIAHGDYNRNNVMFRYPSEIGFDAVHDLRMIDFQETRYGSPCLDLSFYMYMNTTAALREEMWEPLLIFYHDTLIKCLMEIVNCTRDDRRLDPYNFEKFKDHFGRFAFYGALVSVHFSPWLVGTESECRALAESFERDMLSREFHELSLKAGGDKANERLTACVQHASKMGYMRVLEDL